MNPNQIPYDEKINWQEVKMYTNFLLDLSYNDIAQKYDKKAFFDKIFTLAVDDEIIVLRDMMAEDFVPDKLVDKISRVNRDKIIELLANNNSSDTSSLLKQINPNLILPQPFDQADYQQRATKIWNAMQSMKTYISEQIYNEYTGDVNFFSKLPTEKISVYTNEIGIITDKLKNEYNNLMKTGKTDNIVLDKAIDFIGHCGRTPITVNTLKEQHHLGNIADIINKIERAINMVQEMRNKNISNPTVDQIKSEIIDYLIKDTHL